MQVPLPPWLSKLQPQIEAQWQPGRAFLLEAGQAPLPVEASKEALPSLARDLAPRSCLVYEREGRLAAGVTASLGLEFHWLSEGAAQTLTGQIGLELNTGLQARVGYSAAGSWLIQILREDESPLLRLRYETAAVRSTMLALNARADFQVLQEGSAEFPADLLPLREKILARALEAFRRKQQASLALAFSQTASRATLLDASLPQDSPLLPAALAGDLLSLLTTALPGHTLHAGQLTHSLQRRSSIAVTLPYFASRREHFNESLASCEVVEDNGGVLVYSLNSEDSVTSPQRQSSLSLGVALAAVPGARHAVAKAPRFTLSYGLNQYQKQYRLEALPLPFPDAPPVSPQPALFSLQTNLTEPHPGALGEVWLQLSDQSRDQRYQDMSIALQLSLRQWVPSLHFAHPRRYRDIATASALLVWAALPARNHPPGELYWDWLPLANRRESFAHPLFQQKLQHLLSAAPPDFLFAQVKADDPLLHGLLFSEAQLIQAFFQAGRDFSRLAPKLHTQPARAMTLLTRLGAKFTEALHKGAGSVYLGPAARTLGPALLAAASQALAGNHWQFEVHSAARLGLLEEGSAYDPEPFLSTGDFPEELLALSYRLKPA